jgi:hypothetical protein
MLDLVKGLVAPVRKPTRGRSPRFAKPSTSVHPWAIVGIAAAVLFLVAFIFLGQPREREEIPVKTREDVKETTEIETPTPPFNPRKNLPVPPRRTPISAEVDRPYPPPVEPRPNPNETPATPPADVETPTPPDPTPDPTPPSEVPAEPKETPAVVDTEPGTGPPPPTKTEAWKHTDFKHVARKGEVFGDLGAGAVAVVGDVLPLVREGTAGVPVQVLKKGLLVDANGDGKPETQIGKRGGLARIAVTYSNGKSGTIMAKFTRSEGQWYFQNQSCRGGTVEGVRAFLFDENGNGRFNDVGVDTIAIDTETNYAFVKPITLLGEKLYHIRIDEGGTRVETKPYLGKTGHLDIHSRFQGGDAQVITAVVCNENVSVNATALRWPVPLPAGTYRLHEGSVKYGKESIRFTGRKESVIEVSADRITKPHWGAPLTIEFRYTQAENFIQFRASDIHFTGVLGERYVSPNLAQAKALVTIRDAATGRKLREATQSLWVSNGSRPSTGKSSGST